MTYTPDSELDAMILQGWGNTERCEIPVDWQTRKGPEHLGASEHQRRTRTRWQRLRKPLKDSDCRAGLDFRMLPEERRRRYLAGL